MTTINISITKIILVMGKEVFLNKNLSAEGNFAFRTGMGVILYVKERVSC